MLIQKVLNTDPKLFVEIIVGHQNSCNYKGWHITPYLEVFKFYLSSLAYSGYIVHRKRKQMFVIPSSKLTIFPILFLFFGIITSTEWTSSVVKAGVGIWSLLKSKTQNFILRYLFSDILTKGRLEEVLKESYENVPVQGWRPAWALRYSVLVKCRGVIKNKG